MLLVISVAIVILYIMTRVKRGVSATRKRNKILKLTKGYKWDRKKKERAAKEALLHALPRMFKGRKEKKRDMRALWNVKINAAARLYGSTYHELINGIKKSDIQLDRKVLADLAEHDPMVFKKVMEAVK